MRNLILLLSIFGFASIAQAEGVFRWVTDDGTVSFTDDKKRVPKKYTLKTEVFNLEAFKEYDRLTVANSSDKLKRIQTRLKYLRDSRPDQAEQTAPVVHEQFHIVQEMRFIKGVLGYPGRRYVSVDVLYDAEGREIAYAQSSVGFVGLLLTRQGHVE